MLRSSNSIPQVSNNTRPSPSPSGSSYPQNWVKTLSEASIRGLRSHAQPAKASGLSHSIMWGRVLSIFMCGWLLFASDFQQLSSDYTQLLARNSLYDTLDASSLTSQTATNKTASASQSPAPASASASTNPGNSVSTPSGVDKPQAGKFSVGMEDLKNWAASVGDWGKQSWSDLWGFLQTRNLFGATSSPGKSDQTQVNPRLNPLGAGSSSNPRSSGQAAYGQLPLAFEPNEGQFDPAVRFLARGQGYSLFLTDNQAVFALQQPVSPNPSPSRSSASKKFDPFSTAVGNVQHSTRVVAMTLVGTDLNRTAASTRFEGEQPLEGKSNYFIGNDPTRWHTNVSNYSRVSLKEVYPGIDLAYYGRQGQLEYDFIVAPGSDPRAIALKFEGADKLELNAGGELVLHTGGQELRQPLPTIYQEQNGVRQAVKGSYIEKENGQIGFEIGNYNPALALIIDPVLFYSTYLGGTGDDSGQSIAVDGQGNAYVTGVSNSPNFTTTTGTVTSTKGNKDIFVTKLNHDGTGLIYSAYLGGSGDDIGNSIAVDSNGNVIVTGETFSNNFPLQSAYQNTKVGYSDVFILKLNSAGSTLVYSTYLGGAGYSGFGGEYTRDAGLAVKTDQSGNAYIAGYTTARNIPFPTTTGAIQTGSGQCCYDQPDAFVSRLGSDGTLLYSTYLGGDSSEIANGIAVDSTGNIYITGVSYGSSYYRFLATAGSYHAYSGGNSDAFIAKIRPATNGSADLLYFTYLGGTNDDYGSDIAVDSNNNVYVTGYTTSSDFPHSAGASQTSLVGSTNSFVAKFNLAAQGSNDLIYSTYFGNSANTYANRLVLDANNNVYIAGYTTNSSTDFPTTVGAYQRSFGGGTQDAFMAEITPSTTLSGTNALVYATYLGGSGDDQANAIAFDSSGNVYLTGYTTSPDFITTTTALQPGFGGGTKDAFVTKLLPAADLILPPDLDISASDAFTITNQAPQAGSTLTFTLQVRNLSTQNIGGDLILTDNFQGSPIFTQTYTNPVVNVPKLSQQIITQSFTITGTTGIHRICVQIVNTSPADTNLSNNLACKEINLVDPATTPSNSLQISTQPLQTWLGANPTLLTIIRNTGSKALTLTNVNVSGPGYLSVGPVSHLPTTALAPGDEVELSVPITVASSVAGTTGSSFPLEASAAITVASTDGTNSQITNAPSTPVETAQSSPTQLIVNVIDQTTNLPPSQPILLMVEGSEQQTLTSNGTVTLNVLPGPRNLYAYSPDYVALAQPINVISGTTQTITLTLTPGHTVVVSDVAAQELSPQQISDRGLTSDPSNYRYYDFVVNVTLGPPGSGKCSCDVPNVQVPTNPTLGVPYSIAPVAVGGGGSAGSSSTYIAGSYYYPSPDRRVETWFVVPGQIQFLKQFWTVSAFVYNRAVTPITDTNSISLTNASATLTPLPGSGLSLPSIGGTSQSYVQAIGPLAANQGQQVQWVIRGDDPGDYKLKVDVNGQIAFRGANSVTMPTASALSKAIKVYRPILKVDFILPAYYKQGDSFPFKLQITNSSPITLYMVSVKLFKPGLVNVTLSGSDTVSVGTIAPNGTGSATFTLVSQVEGCASSNSFVTADPSIVPNLIFQPYALCQGAYTYCLGCMIKHAMGDPINPAIGNYFTSVDDMEVAKPAGSYVGLEVKRTYNTLDRTVGLFGSNWRFSYDTRLYTNAPDGKIIMVNPDGRQDVYFAAGNGAYVTPPLANATLVKDSGGGTYTLTRADQVRYVYDPNGTLTDVWDRNNNHLHLAYSYDANSNGNLTVTDNYARVLTFTVANGRAVSVSDGSRTSYYAYDRDLYLTTVTDTRGYAAHYGYTTFNNTTTGFVKSQ